LDTFIIAQHNSCDQDRSLKEQKIYACSSRALETWLHNASSPDSFEALRRVSPRIRFGISACSREGERVILGRSGRGFSGGLEQSWKSESPNN
jgi:hypothetical protein